MHIAVGILFTTFFVTFCYHALYTQLIENRKKRNEKEEEKKGSHVGVRSLCTSVLEGKKEYAKKEKATE
jgi:hypothetical protein